MEDNAQLTSYLVESLNGMQTVKAFNAERKANYETESRFVKLLKECIPAQLHRKYAECPESICRAGGRRIVILWVGGVDVIHGTLTMGQLITFQSLARVFSGSGQKPDQPSATDADGGRCG